MQELIELLENIQPDVDYTSCTTLIDDHIFDSLLLLVLIADLEEVYDITIPTVEIIPENFNSATAIYQMIQRLQED